ncbi:NACHT domain-containing protein [Achromobacter spanius]|uniref:NACHT domain-containing protein n=1 Tax=Achromobacter spanius TaxID=217203 RepID=UPI003A9425AC
MASRVARDEMISKRKTEKRMTGGSAAERGLDFQARVSAIVMAHLLIERSIGWLEGVLDDTPLELHAETGGPGDDIRFSVKDGKRVELQAKRGLQRGDDLWDALLDLSRGISDGTIDAGVLAVCPNSSGTIREALAEDIVRLGAGRTDGLREIGQAWGAKLSASSLDATLVCARLRIIVISAVDGNREAEATAAERLGRIVQNQGAAWPVLVEYGRRLIRRRERSIPENIYRALSLANIALKTTEVDTRVQLSAAIRQWLRRTYASMTVLGVHTEIPFDACWLELDAQAMDDALTEQEDLDKALRRYHEYGHSPRNGGLSFHSQTIARFVKKCVVLGGPGMGKSTLLKKLALDYSGDGFLTLLVRLPQVVALLAREGRRFEESLMEVALSASGLRAPLVSLEGAVILCDALDECGSQQPLVTANLHAFSVAHPNTRVVVTSRPIGYRSGELAGWRHYELQPLDDTAAEKAVTKVLEAIPFASAALRSRAVEQAMAQLSAKTIKGAAARSPLMITLVAALSVKGIDPGLSKGGLYRKLFQLLQDHPPARLTERPPSEPERNRFLEMLGWCLLSHGNEPAEQTLSRCARWWSEETGQSFLVSETKISECFSYWECLGIVERVRTHTQEAITFVHKTFGEFAAARYMSKCAPESQRGIIGRAIGTPDWKEALSFASHLGLTSLILQVWAEFAERGDTKAGNRLDDAVELVVQAGAPLASDTLASFAQCCWRAVENTASRMRYAAGEALCLMSQEHWSLIKEGVLARLESPDGWNRLVAWACLCISTDQRLATPALTEALPRLADSRPTDSYLGGFSLRPNGNAVWQHLVLGAARRILVTPPEPEALRVLRELIGDAKGLNVGTIGELERVFRQAGQELSGLLDGAWSKNMARLMPDRERWNREAAYLLALIENPLEVGEEADSADAGHSFELGACMTAISYWETPVGNSPSATASASVDAARRLVIHALARGAGLDHSRLVRQARAMKREILQDVKNEAFGFLDLPKVDAKAELDHPLADKQFMPVLEELIVGPCHLFALNAAYVLYSMNEDPEYSGAVKRVLTRGRGESLRLSVALAKQLPDETGQQLILDRLCQGESTPGCRHLYLSLTAPYDARHLEAVRKGLGGSSADAAKAAAGLVKEFPLDGALAGELRAFFDEWRAKDPPYPKGGGVVPESPRDELAKVLAAAFTQDHEFLLTLLTDERPEVRSAARDHFLPEAAGSALLRSKLLEGTVTGRLRPDLLRAAVLKGLYAEEEAIAVARLLHSEDARLRYAALPILDVKYLQLDQVRDECSRLLTDDELDIREGASRALHGLETSSSEP